MIYKRNFTKRKGISLANNRKKKLNLSGNNKKTKKKNTGGKVYNIPNKKGGGVINEGDKVKMPYNYTCPRMPCIEKKESGGETVQTIKQIKMDEEFEDSDVQFIGISIDGPRNKAKVKIINP